MEGVRLYSRDEVSGQRECEIPRLELFERSGVDPARRRLFESGERSPEKQETHTRWIPLFYE
jgi:hypothetical protein